MEKTLREQMMAIAEAIVPDLKTALSTRLIEFPTDEEIVRVVGDRLTALAWVLKPRRAPGPLHANLEVVGEEARKFYREGGPVYPIPVSRRGVLGDAGGPLDFARFDSKTSMVKAWSRQALASTPQDLSDEDLPQDMEILLDQAAAILKAKRCAVVSPQDFLREIPRTVREQYRTAVIAAEDGTIKIRGIGPSLIGCASFLVREIWPAFVALDRKAPRWFIAYRPTPGLKDNVRGVFLASDGLQIAIRFVWSDDPATTRTRTDAAEVRQAFLLENRHLLVRGRAEEAEDDSERECPASIL